MSAGSVALLGAALCSCAAVSAAEPGGIPGGSGGPARPAAFSELGVSAAIAVTAFGYKELDDSGAILDREDGTIPGLLLGASWRRGPWEIAADFGYFRWDAQYEGVTNTGVAIATRSREEMASGSLRVHYRLGNGALAPYAGFGYHRWDRTIRPTSTSSGTPVQGLFEAYSWWTGEIGAKVRVTSWGRLRAWVDFRLVRIMAPSVDVEFANGMDDTTLELGARTGYRLGTPVSCQLTPFSDLPFEVYYERWNFGRSGTTDLTSDGIRVGTLHEPRSETRNTGLMVGFRRRF